MKQDWPGWRYDPEFWAESNYRRERGWIGDFGRRSGYFAAGQQALLMSGGAGDVYYNNTVLLINPTGSGTFADQSYIARGNFTAAGNAVLSTTQTKFSSSSIAMDGSGDNANIGHDSTKDPFYGQTKGMIEGWYYATDNSSILRFLFSSRTATSDTGGCYMYKSTSDRLVGVQIGAAGNVWTYTITTAFTMNAWNHVVMSLDTTVASSYQAMIGMNGVNFSQNAGTLSASIGAPNTTTFWIGSSNAEAGNRDFQGYVGPHRQYRGCTRIGHLGTTYIQPTAAFPTSL